MEVSEVCFLNDKFSGEPEEGGGMLKTG